MADATIRTSVRGARRSEIEELQGTNRRVHKLPEGSPRNDDEAKDEAGANAGRGDIGQVDHEAPASLGFADFTVSVMKSCTISLIEP